MNDKDRIAELEKSLALANAELVKSNAALSEANRCLVEANAKPERIRSAVIATCEHFAGSKGIGGAVARHAAYVIIDRVRKLDLEAVR